MATGKKKPAAGKVCPRCNCAGEFGPNRARADGLQTYCRPCMREFAVARGYDKQRWEQNRAAESERNRAYRKAAAETLKPHDRARAAIRRAEKPAAIRAHNIARKHGQKRATPPWANLSAMNAVYAEAKRLQAADGVARHVDHDIPLKHPLVCGLHVENNLRILSAAQNMAKHNAFEAV